MNKFKKGDLVIINAVEITKRDKQIGNIAYICDDREVYDCRVKFPDNHVDDMGELFYFTELRPAKNYIVSRILKDL